MNNDPELDDYEPYHERSRVDGMGCLGVLCALVLCGSLVGGLSACQTPATRTQTVEVKVPVAVQPIKPEQVPAAVPPLGPRPSSLSSAADLLLSKWCQAVGYMLRADPLLRVSAGQASADLPKYPECER